MAEAAIADRLRKWSEKKRRPSKPEPGAFPVHPIGRDQARGIARELLAAVHRAIHSEPVTAEVWQAYVALYAALQGTKVALQTVASLPFQYQHLQGELSALERQIDGLVRPAESSSSEQAAFYAGGTRYAFQKRRRGRSLIGRAEVVRQAIAVWMHRFNSLPPSYPGSVFDEVLRLACECLGMDERTWPGLNVIRAELAHFKDAGSADSFQPQTLRLYPGRAPE
ncbi:hypothetical protein Q3O98_12020 [Ralstonia pseudosolanacearum]|uniref:hypothetical protein n=1 Tax=Ralstonia pseudosolanacearum TaxID=1310165 RepID=UPI0026747024|nr:hypothetical protein [Ralstonia pseudosolanacearum]MDO3621827.1 hypothetical protein [Ralstonia pseudosolanacearum]